jgi:hypothetical protein
VVKHQLPVAHGGRVRLDEPGQASQVCNAARQWQPLLWGCPSTREWSQGLCSSTREWPTELLARTPKCRIWQRDGRQTFRVYPAGTRLSSGPPLQRRLVRLSKLPRCQACLRSKLPHDRAIRHASWLRKRPLLTVHLVVNGQPSSGLCRILQRNRDGSPWHTARQA